MKKLGKVWINFPSFQSDMFLVLFLVFQSIYVQLITFQRCRQKWCVARTRVSTRWPKCVAASCRNAPRAARAAIQRLPSLVTVSTNASSRAWLEVIDFSRIYYYNWLAMILLSLLNHSARKILWMTINLFSSSGVQRNPRLHGWRGWKELRQSLRCELFKLLFWWNNLSNFSWKIRSNAPAAKKTNVFRSSNAAMEFGTARTDLTRWIAGRWGLMSRENGISSLICSVPRRTRSCATATAIPIGCVAMDSPTAPMEATSWAALVKVSWRRFEEKLQQISFRLSGSPLEHLHVPNDGEVHASWWGWWLHNIL